MNEGTKKWMNLWIYIWMNELMNEWINEWMNEWINENRSKRNNALHENTHVDNDWRDEFIKKSTTDNWISWRMSNE